MKPAPIPINESERLQALYRFDILDTPPEVIFDDIISLASFICDTPIALLSLVDSERQWFKSRVGIQESESPRDISFCGHAIVTDDDLFIVNDTLVDERFKDNPLVTNEPSIRFYAGAKLVTHDGFNIGTICVIDKIPRKLSEQQLDALQSLRRHVMISLEYRSEHERLTKLLIDHQAQTKKLKETEELFQDVVERAQEIICRTDMHGHIVLFNTALVRLSGYSADELLGKHYLDFFPARFQENIRNLYRTQRDNKLQETYFECPVLTKDGKELWVGQNVTTLWGEETITGYQVVARDITERRHGEELREKLIRDLEQAIYNVKTLTGLLPICASCKKIRDDSGYWNQVEAYLIEHTDLTLTHGICPECMKKLYPQYYKEK
ncbi:MAG: PAS domain S-box protein [Ignavibacteriae bacterium]|nr:PAS domain S-box protein [Ignavibacteriota bacterium]